ncbi:hypothetical protein ACIA8O_14430 [Kitasatospora sp. NPDC051853]|uniref:hypothetical protein n=1 Tax=Kitasatospora sp. NPDC051853 TaxID=3364058 RepID=UPI003797F605
MVSPVLKALMVAPLALGAGYLFLLLTLFPGSTGTLFAWQMSPVSAALLGAGYGGSCAMYVLALRAHRWVDIRVAVTAGALFMPLAGLATLLGRSELQLTGGPLVGVLAAWGWTAVHAGAPLLGLIALTAQWLAREERPPRPPRLPWWVAGPVTGHGLGLTVIGLLLYAVPGPAVRHWPWAAGQLEVRMLGAWCLVFGAALLLTWVEAELRRVRNGMAALLVTGTFGLIGLVREAGQVSWDQTGAWAVVLVLCAFLGLGLSGLGVGWMLDPALPQAPPAPVDAHS